jgi:hypothetical protein
VVFILLEFANPKKRQPKVRDTPPTKAAAWGPFQSRKAPAGRETIIVETKARV